MKPDLTVCENVEFEMRDDVPGLTFSKDGFQGLTPVLHQKKRRQMQKMTTARSTEGESSEEELTPVYRRPNKWCTKHGMVCQGSR